MEGVPDTSLRLDAPREEALARASELIALAWKSFDRFRPEEPPLDDPQLSVVPFRHVPGGVEDVSAHNQALAEAIQADGRVYLGSALIDGDVYLRPCFVNYRTNDVDVMALVEVTRGREPAGKGASVTDELLPAERKVHEKFGHLLLDFGAMAVVSNLFRASAAIRRHMDRLSCVQALPRSLGRAPKPPSPAIAAWKRSGW